MRRYLPLLALLLSAAPVRAAGTEVPRVFISLISGRDLTGDINLMSMNITNYGFIGNNFTVRTPSMEYPVGTGHEHLVRGGLWVGAVAADEAGPFTGVTTAAVDGVVGNSTASATEFSPIGDHIDVRSSLTNNQRYDPTSVSERDLLSFYDDVIAKRAQTGGINEDHRPLGITVRQENYSWSFADYRHTVFFHYVIKNTGAPLVNVHVGLYNELASGAKNNFSNWPPGGAWFNKKQVAWIDSLSMYTERYCTSAPIPNNCFYSIAPEVVGVKFLGATPGTTCDNCDHKLTMQSWNFFPGDATKDEDVERYALMSTGTRDLPPFLPPADDPVQLIAVGPFPLLATGDSITVDFAYIGATSPELLDKRAHTAQRAYDLHYIVPVPPPSPRFKAVARDGAIDYYWDDSPESFLDPTSPTPRDFEGYRLYAGSDRDSLSLLAQFDLGGSAPNDTTGFNTGFSAIRLATPALIDGVPYHYKYTLPQLRDGFKYFCAVTAYDLGTTEIESLESGRTQNEAMVVPAPRAGERAGGVVVFPNPYRVEAQWDAGRGVREHFLWFANMPPRATVRIYTLAGDLVYDKTFDGSTYNGSNARGIYNPASDLPGTFSGATFGWDLVTNRGQAAATGLYLWSVEDRDTGNVQRGKVLLVKSDREGLQ